jgi:hypothetical protein
MQRQRVVAIADNSRAYVAEATRESLSASTASVPGYVERSRRVRREQERFARPHTGAAARSIPARGSTGWCSCTEACVRFFGVGQYLLFRHCRHLHPNTGITFRGRATPAFARALPVARTSPLGRTGASAVVRPRDCIRPKGGVPGGRALARIQLIEAPAILKCGSAERRG